MSRVQKSPLHLQSVASGLQLGVGVAPTAAAATKVMAKAITAEKRMIYVT